MAIVTIVDGKIYYGGYNLSASFNELALDAAAEMKDVTTFGSGGTRINKPGLMTVQISGKGLQDFDDTGSPSNPSIDAILMGAIGAVESVFSTAREGNAEGDVAYAVKAVTATITPVQGSVGDMFEFSIEAQGGGTRLMRGRVLALGTKSVTGTGTAFQLGAVTSGQRVYGALHVVRPVTAGTLDMVVQSDDAQAFTTPTARLTFAQNTAIGSEWKEAAGPITDTWWRASWTIGGGGSFPVFLVVGIH